MPRRAILLGAMTLVWVLAVIWATILVETAPDPIHQQRRALLEVILFGGSLTLLLYNCFAVLRLAPNWTKIWVVLCAVAWVALTGWHLGVEGSRLTHWLRALLFIAAWLGLSAAVLKHWSNLSLTATPAD